MFLSAFHCWANAIYYFTSPTDGMDRTPTYPAPRLATTAAMAGNTDANTRAVGAAATTNLAQRGTVNRINLYMIVVTVTEPPLSSHTTLTADQRTQRTSSVLPSLGLQPRAARVCVGNW